MSFVDDLLADADDNPLRFAKVEKWDFPDEEGQEVRSDLTIGAIRGLVEEGTMKKADENRGMDLFSVRNCEPEDVLSCMVWKEDAVQAFLQQVADGTQTVSTTCRVVVYSAVGGSELDGLTRKIWNRNKQKLTTDIDNDKCEFQIYDGANRIKVLLAFMYGKLTMNKVNGEGVCEQKVYYTKELAVANGDAREGDDGEITLADGVWAMSEGTREQFEKRRWNLFLLNGTAEQCCRWARNENLERTAFEYDQELPLVLGSQQGGDDDYCARLLQPLRNDWVRTNIGDTPVVNAGMLLSYALLKFHGMYTDKKAHEINTPAGSKLRRLKDILSSGTTDGDTIVANTGRLNRIFEVVKEVMSHILDNSGVSHMIHMHPEKQRRLRFILCVIIDNEVEGIEGYKVELMHRAKMYYNESSRPTNTHAYRFLRGETSSLGVPGRAARSRTPRRASRSSTAGRAARSGGGRRSARLRAPGTASRTPRQSGLMSPHGRGQMTLDSMLGEQRATNRRRVSVSGL